MHLNLVRSDYFMTYLGEALLSIHEDGVPLAGAFSWGMFHCEPWHHDYSRQFLAMVDNAEWGAGVATR